MNILFKAKTSFVQIQQPTKSREESLREFEEGNKEANKRYKQQMIDQARQQEEEMLIASTKLFRSEVTPVEIKRAMDEKYRDGIPRFTPKPSKRGFGQ